MRCELNTFTLCPLPFALALCAALGGCGYQFQVDESRPTIGGAAQADAKPERERPRLAIPIFENHSFEPNIEVKYTTYARREFAAVGGARVVPEGEPADLVLKVQIVSLSLPSLTFTPTSTFESRARVTARAVLEDARTHQPLWTQTATASSEFFVTQDLQFNRVLQRRAVEQAGRLIVEDLAVRFLDFLETGQRAGDKSKVGTQPAPNGGREGASGVGPSRPAAHTQEAPLPATGPTR